MKEKAEKKERGSAYFTLALCEIFTILVVLKLILEKIMGIQDNFYTENLLFMLFIVVAGTFVLSLHTFLKKMPLLFVILLQYVLLLSVVMGSLFFLSHFISMAPGGYFDMFLSVGVPYVILALVYYISYFKQVKKANKTIKELQKLRYEEKKE